MANNGFTYNDKLYEGKAILMQDSLRSNVIPIEGNQLILFYCIAFENTSYSPEGDVVMQYLFVQPNDTITITANEDSHQVNIQTKYQDETKFWKWIKSKGFDYLKSIESNISYSPDKLDENINLLNYYRSERERLSMSYIDSLNLRKEFRTFIHQLNNLIYSSHLPIPSGANQYNEYFLGNNKLLNIFKDVKQKLLIPTEKFSSFDFYYSNALMAYYRFMAYDNTSFGKEPDFGTIFQTIVKEFDGEYRDLALTLLMKEGLKNGKTYQLFSEYKKICKNISFVTMIEKGVLDIDFANNEVNNERLTDSDGLSLTWKDFINKQLGKPTYIDFWATWCKGCKLSVPKVKKMKKESPEISIVYFSIDENEATWKKNIAPWGLKEFQHYHINPHSKLAEKLAKPSIPRYTLINKKGEVVTTDAPNPLSPQLKEVIKNLPK